MNVKIFAKTIDEKALQQIHKLASVDAFKNSKIRIMPDVHAGAGCVIGFTADLGNKVIPNVVGVDIGCGMLTVCLGKVDIDFEKLDKVIRERVPSGMNVHKLKIIDLHVLGLRCFDALKNIEWLEASIGTLGGGNHFIEVDEDEAGAKYLIIHTGSRNLGKQVCDYYQNIAVSNLIGTKRDVRRVIEEYKAQGRESEIAAAIHRMKSEDRTKRIPKDLCYLEGQDRLDYLHDMRICQLFAMHNRALIAGTICGFMNWDARDAFETVHNYIDHESNIVRKGAISAKKGERVLIPMNMRDGCIIGIGKGNPEWNYSAPHGAGRIMSRMQAKKEINIDEYKNTMTGIYTTSVCKETIDEAPQAYKPMQEIVECISETVSIEKIIKPIYNFKAAE